MGYICQITFKHIRRPLRVIFETALGSKTAIDSIMVRVRLNGGEEGWGEIPTSFAYPCETLEAIRGVFPIFKAALMGTSVEDYPDLIRGLRERFPALRMTLSGVEVALFRASLACRGLDEWRFWGGECLTCRSDITIPFTRRQDLLMRWLSVIAREGFSEFKVKTSGELEQDICHINTIDAYLKESGQPYLFRIDANQGYNPQSFIKFMTACDKKALPIELVEQPLPKHDYAGHREIRKATSVPIILDEGVQSPEDLQRAISEDACDGVNIKVAKSGITESKQILKEARRHGLKLMIGCMTETMTGLSAAIRMAAGTGAFDFHDLDSIHFLFHRGQYHDIACDGAEYRIL